MTDRVRRPYSSPRRAQQARETREAILDAAMATFADEGYPAATVDQVAGTAGVSAKTVYLAFGSKSGVLRAVWDRALKGDTDPSAVAERPWYRDVLEEPDPRAKVAKLAAGSVAVKQRIAPVLKMLRSAAETDDDLRALWALIQTDFHANQRVVVDSLAALGALRNDLTVERATDVLWTLNHPDQWYLLVGDRGWSPEEFETWLDRTVADALLEPATVSAAPRARGRTAPGRGGRSPR